MKILKTLLCFIIVSFLPDNTLHAQNQVPTTIDSLSAYKWQMIEADYVTKLYDHFLIYDQQTETDIVIWYEDEDGQEEEDIMVNAYYLSDVPVTIFDSSKVGKVKNGRYIIVKAGADCAVYWIDSLTDNKLVLISVENPTITEWKSLPK